jgi:hypothetical protein
MAQFGLVSPEQWKIDEGAFFDGRPNLLGIIPFDEILKLLTRSIERVEIVHEKAKKAPGQHRYYLLFHSTPQAVDLWHNSRGGYRAQFFIDKELGDAANAHAAQVLLAEAQRRIDGDPLLQRKWSKAHLCFPEPSLKVWIKEGLWWRRARLDHRALFVPKWEANRDSTDAHIKDCWRWAGLIPAGENRFVLKGEWLDQNDKRAGVLKPLTMRTHQIHTCGYT